MLRKRPGTVSQHFTQNNDYNIIIVIVLQQITYLLGHVIEAVSNAFIIRMPDIIVNIVRWWNISESIEPHISPRMTSEVYSADWVNEFR